MIKIEEAVIVEGKYDKIKLENIIDAPIITTDGFGIFKDKEKQNLIKRLASEKGILILTDSDSAGFLIRKFLKGSIDNSLIRHAYIPDIFGKEKRKAVSSAEGKLGVEGVPDKIIEECLLKAGISVSRSESKEQIKKSDLYEDGFIGKENSANLRKKLIKKLDLPENISANSLLEYMNILLTKEDYDKAVKEIDDDENRSRIRCPQAR